MIKPKTISLPFGVGVDTKTQEKLVGNQKLLEAQNARVSDGDLVKRFGYEQLGSTFRKASSSTVNSSGTLATGSAFGAFNQETLLFDNQSIFSESISQNEWIEKGQNIGIAVESDSLLTVDSDLRFSDSVLEGNLLFSIFYDVDGESYKLNLIDTLTGASYLNNIEIDSSTGALGYCRAAFLNGSFYGFFVNGNNLKRVNVSLGDLTDVSTLTTISSSATGRFDLVRVDDTRAAIAFNDTSNDVILGLFNASAMSTSTQTINEDANYSVALAFDADTLRLFVFMAGSTITSTSADGVIYQIFEVSGANTNPNNILASTDIFAAEKVRVNRMSPVVVNPGECVIGLELNSRTIGITDADVTNADDKIDIGAARYYTGQAVTITGAAVPGGLVSGTPYYVINTFSGGSADEIRLAASRANALIGTQINLTTDGTGAMTIAQQEDGYTNRIVWYEVDDAGSATAFNSITRDVGLASKPIKINDTQIAFAANHQSEFQSTMFLYVLDIEADAGTPAVCKFNVNRAGGLLDVPVLPQLYSIDENNFGMTSSRVVRIESNSLEYDFDFGLAKQTFNLDVASRYFNVQLGQNTIISGGIIKAYDGVSATELGFNLFPHDIYAEAENSGGSLAAATYGVLCVYRWIDNQGLVHRSAPSILQSVTVSGGSSQINVECPYLRITDKTAANLRSDIVIELYMTQLDGTVFYLRDTAVNNAATSDAYQATFAITSQPAGTEEILYTTGGVLENIAPPPSTAIAASKNRLFVINAENRKEYWYSQKVAPQIGLQFSDSLRNQIQEGTAELRAVATMDDKAVFFERSRLHFISGDGPNLLGLNNTFTAPQLINNQVGCSNPDSIVFYAEGLGFQSADKGWWLLNRGLQLQYFGADVEEFKDLQVTSANILEDRNELRWTTKEGSVLIYDYYVQQWTTDSRLPANDAIYNNDRYYLLRASDGIVWVENQGFLDNGNKITLQVTTAWLKLSSIQGYQRIKRASILGDFKSNHKLKIEIGYDYEAFYRNVLVWNAGDVLQVQTFGDDATFGGDDVFGGVSDGVYQVRMVIPRQKSQSIRFRITDVTEENPGESMSLSVLDLKVGVKRGLFKTRKDKQV